jgi:pimeloyl-ACP methyl ester carboxylesterase
VAHDLRQVLWVVGAGVAGGAFAFGVGIAVYVLGSFFLMAGHVDRRPFGVSLRELVREAVLAALTQPLLPLFYFVGRRMDGFLLRRALAGKTPIVFVHGYMQNRVDFLGLARAFARRGLGPLYAINYPWFSTLEKNAARLDRFIAEVCEETGAAAVDLVCHSMGGLVAVEMMRDEARKDALKVRRLVTIASPHGGVMWRGPILGSGGASLRRGSKVLEAHAGHTLAVPTLSVYSTHDNVVHPKQTSSLANRGGTDFEVDGSAHLSILFSPVVIEQVASFLSEDRP